MALLRRIRDWEPRFRLLFPHPIPTVTKRLDEHIGRLLRWLVRDKSDHSIPSTVDKAAEMIATDIAELRALTELLAVDEYRTRLTVDTNTLIDNPDLAAHVPTLGRRYMVHLLPVVLREVDDLKRAGRTEDLRQAGDRLPTWLDLTVPDDRFVASSLLVQSDHPGSALYVATSDINLQTKLAAVGLPFVELPSS